MTARTPSQIGRASRAKGNKFQSDMARELRPWFPEAVSGRDNGWRKGDFAAPDTGDLAHAGDKLFWSLKNVEAATAMPPGLIMDWLTEARTKARGRIPLLVLKRKGHQSTLRSWCWLWLSDLVDITTGDNASALDMPVLVELGNLLPLLARTGLTEVSPTSVAEVV